MKELALLKSLWSERVSRSVELIVPIKTSSSGSYIDSGHWAYDVPFGFRVALDLSYDRRIKNRIPYYVWTQGPLLNFKLGDVLHSHDGSKCVQVEFAIAMQWNAEKQKMDTGFVEFAHYLIIDGAYRLEKKEILDQMEFLKMLITGC